MTNPLLKLSAFALLAIAPLAHAQTARSDAGALTSVLSRATTEQGQALVRTLARLPNRQPGPGALGSTWDIVIQTAEGNDADVLRGYRDSANSFDRESVAILARAAQHGTLNDTIAIFTNVQGTPNWNTPLGQSMVVEENILMNLKAKMPAGPAATYERVIRGLENRGGSGEPNYGYRNAQEILVENLGDGRQEFLAAWGTLDYDDREVALQLVRDAFLRGLADL